MLFCFPMFLDTVVFFAEKHCIHKELFHFLLFHFVPGYVLCYSHVQFQFCFVSRVPGSFL
jgi:hypothetical protein